MNPNVELLLDAKATVGEGVCWDAQRRVLYWVDILGEQVHIFDPASGQDRCIQLDQYVGAVVPTTEDDLLLVAVQHGIALLDRNTQELTPICDPESHLPDNRFNDGKCDPDGRFFAGTMHVEGKPGAGALYRLDPDLSIRRLFDGVGISNGLAWSPDGRTMYYIDTTTARVDAFDYDRATGDISNRRAAIQFAGSEFAHPDGMTIDEHGMLWIAYFGGGCVARWDPSRAGALLDVVRLPVSLTTNCTFGGPDLDTLYISSCRLTLSYEQLKAEPLAGGLFRVRPGVRGLPARPFRMSRRPRRVLR